uniref:Armadillo repeat containing 10 n=1 Tax=Oryctolagus cuniculus TaxID=9986 RepID=A0A5F9D1F4_RABIT|nr:armadillo repeat-containing protein 10 [Oryctolagus cuniculus]XP_017198224.1 armadillo repeat-containing protein 10 [Oryctolagus cuniculus]XP_017198225.1 armadillo repeat-containing protein 10 [Oryctolagus cuniculus]
MVAGLTRELRPADSQRPAREAPSHGQGRNASRRCPGNRRVAGGRAGAAVSRAGGNRTPPQGGGQGSPEGAKPVQHQPESGAQPAGRQPRGTRSGWFYGVSGAASGRRSSGRCFLPQLSCAPVASGPAHAAGLHQPCPSGGMIGVRHASWVAAGLVLGAGACYGIYLLTRGRRRGGRGLGPRRSGSAEDLTSGSHDDVLNASQLQKLLYLLESTEDPVITERALVTLGNSAAFSANQAIIRELGGIPVVGNKLNNPNQSIKEKALNALNNLSVNVENQVKIKMYIHQVCEDVLSGPLNSAVQLAGLRLLTNMTVTNDHQHMLSSYITDLFHVLLAGNGHTKVQVLKLIVNLSENPAMTEGLLTAQVDSSFLALYDGHVAKEILLRVLTLFQNINNCLKTGGRLAVRPPSPQGSLSLLLYGEECAQKMRALASHQDADVQEKAVTIIPEF